MKLIETYYKTELGRSIEEYLIDTDAELASLPKAPVGSYAVSVESGKKFFINSSGEWPDPSKYVGGGGGSKPEGTIHITENGTHDVTEYASAEVMVQSGDGWDAVDALIDGSISGEISSNVKTLRSNAFTGCTLLTSARFPLAEGTIKSTFEGCSNLETVDLPLMTKITGKAFNRCTNLKQANLQSVTEIADCTSSYDGPFFYCDSLENVILTSLKSMGSMAFYSARGLSFIDLPSLTSIRNSCFVGCEKFTTMVLRSESVVTLSNVSAFSNTPFRGYNGLRGTFYVKQHLIEEYKTTATNWPALYAEGYCDFLPIEGSEYE